MSFVNFGDVCRSRLGMQCEYVSRYVNPNFSSESAIAAGHHTPFCGEGLRINGDPSNYHSLTIHEEDIIELVKRVNVARRV